MYRLHTVDRDAGLYAQGLLVRGGIRSVETELRCVTNLYHGLACDATATSWQHCQRDDLYAY